MDLNKKKKVILRYNQNSVYQGQITPYVKKKPIIKGR